MIQITTLIKKLLDNEHHYAVHYNSPLDNRYIRATTDPEYTITDCSKEYFMWLNIFDVVKENNYTITELK